MAELPEIVRQRLTRQIGGEHPDPDLLTAFAEGALGERERTQVLAHLGVCATCREVVSLALPETPTLQPAHAPVQSRWLRWPVLRWGAVVATVVVVAAAVMWREPRRAAVMDGGSTASIAEYKQRAAAEPTLQDKENRPEATDAAATKKTSAPKPAGRNEMKLGAADGRKQAGGVVIKNAPAATRLDGLQKKDQAGEIQQQRGLAGKAPSQIITPQQDAQQYRAQQQAAAASRQPFEGGAVGGVQQQGQLSMSQQAAPAAQAAPTQAPPSPARVRQNVVADRDEAVATATSAEVSAAKSTVMRKAAAERVLPARWRISSEGKVERSLNAGGSWQVVPVHEGARFRAVSAIEGDVWAGGVAGALYHSANGGQSWVRVAFASSDISRVEFTDRLHGIVTTASGETWITADGGRTWTPRQP